MNQVPRLVFLAAELREKAPQIPRSLRPYVRSVELIDAVRSGIDGASLELDIPRAQVRQLIETGKKQSGGAAYDEATPESFRLGVAKEILDNTALEDLDLTSRVELLGALSAFVNDDGSSEMFALEEHSLGDVKGVPPMPKWDSGFVPLDMALGGCYQSLAIIMAKPGTGKTSTMLTMAEAMKRKHPNKRILFFEVEIPAKMLMGRMGPIYDRGNPFDQDDRLFCGPISVEEILKITREGHAEGKEQIVFVDSPDAMAGGGVYSDRRFELEHLYRQLIRVKESADLVVVASQPNRNNAALVKMEGVAEAWQKAWYADIIFSIGPVGFKKFKLKTLKNRFGPPDGEVIYDYDLSTLEYGTSIEMEDDW